MVVKRIFESIDGAFEEYKSFWREICEMETPSEDKESIDRLAEYISKFSKGKGFQVRTEAFENAGCGLVISINDNVNAPGIAFMAHMDTVHRKGDFGYPAVTERDGYFYGPGVGDCKGGIAVALLVMEALMSEGYNKRPLKLILTPDEEVSNQCSGQDGIDFILKESTGLAAAFSCETGLEDGAVTVGRRGILQFEIEITGKAVHAGANYADGISAIKEAAYKIIELEKESHPEKITYNCGVINGGTVVNAVPEHCTFRLDIRINNNEERERALSHLNKVVSTSYIAGTKSELKELGVRPVMEQTDGNMELFYKYREACKKYGFQEKTPFFRRSGSDAAYSVIAGTPSICSVGAVGGDVHSLREWADIGSLSVKAKELACTIIDYL